MRLRVVQTKKCGTVTIYSLLQQSHGNMEAKSEESDFSQESEVSQASQGTESSQEETEHLEPWSRIFNEAEKRHETQFNTLINEYEGNRDSENVARIKAENALFLVYRNELRKVLLRISTVDACDEKRSHLPKSDGNPKRA